MLFIVFVNKPPVIVRLASSQQKSENIELFKKELKNRFDLFIKKYGTKRFVLHVSGHLYSEYELSTFSEIISPFKDKSLVIEYVESPIRLYEQYKGKFRPAPPGTQLKISNNEIAVLTFPLRRNFSTPDPILCRGALGDLSTFEEEVKNAYFLCHGYIGYENRQIRTPVTVYTASESMRKFINGDYTQLLTFTIPWFI